MPDVSIIVTVHHERDYVGAALSSARNALEQAALSGLQGEILIVMDLPDSGTREAVEAWIRNNITPACATAKTLTVDFGDVSKSRMHGVSCAKGRYIAFLDGDDALDRYWIQKAFQAAAAEGHPLVVWHAEWLVTFGTQIYVYQQIQSTDNDFNSLDLLVQWYFRVDVFVLRSIFDMHPLLPMIHKSGIYGEDWHWSCETIASGIPHRCVPGTAQYYRRHTQPSLSKHQKMTIRRTRLFRREGESYWRTDVVTELGRTIRLKKMLRRMRFSYAPWIDRTYVWFQGFFRRIQTAAKGTAQALPPPGLIAALQGIAALDKDLDAAMKRQDCLVPNRLATSLPSSLVWPRFRAIWDCDHESTLILTDRERSRTSRTMKNRKMFTFQVRKDFEPFVADLNPRWRTDLLVRLIMECPARRIIIVKCPALLARIEPYIHAFELDHEVRVVDQLELDQIST